MFMLNVSVTKLVKVPKIDKFVLEDWSQKDIDHHLLKDCDHHFSFKILTNFILQLILSLSNSHCRYLWGRIGSQQQ